YEQAPFPLVIISHGYPGNRFLLSHLGESLSSRGYVVASIDHLESTYSDQQAFTSTLYFRTLDQRFILDQIADLGQSRDSFLNGLLDAERTAVIGYSMGGYGLVNNLGAGYNPGLVNTPIAPPNQLLGEHTETNPAFRDSLDPRIVAGVAIAPWGMNNNLWRVDDLQNISVPALYVAGTADGVSGYENGTRYIFEQATGSDRYLLTFENAGHNAGAPIPVPLEILESESGAGASHYTDPVWDTVRMNNVMDHFVVAFLDYHLKGMEEQLKYLDLPVTPTDEWYGFSNGPAVGLRLEHRQVGE
ncbi:MAG: dienelactone hydrolase, partial [Gammaproteobacteria bacterium]|nr:dienelactone hydrolase [Gammaproteobacteria bacterium]